MLEESLEYMCCPVSAIYNAIAQVMLDSVLINATPELLEIFDLKN